MGPQSRYLREFRVPVPRDCRASGNRNGTAAMGPARGRRARVSRRRRVDSRQRSARPGRCQRARSGARRGWLCARGTARVIRRTVRDPVDLEARRSGAHRRWLRISRKEGQRFTARRSMVSRHVGPLPVMQDCVTFSQCRAPVNGVTVIHGPARGLIKARARGTVVNRTG